uniref:Uncharacterized protein n=1 Tax=Prorocentrum micans TaxID=2945 RepID=A0A7S2TF40_PROMC|mmetsp:Transcript_5712/g.4468  ORF Transcript_5712/g.4468 Transcript_5712/m.4468 type:complete len:102 (+) Transcript_5712:55-360(+)
MWRPFARAGRCGPGLGPDCSLDPALQAVRSDGKVPLVCRFVHTKPGAIDQAMEHINANTSITVEGMRITVDELQQAVAMYKSAIEADANGGLKIHPPLGFE